MARQAAQEIRDGLDIQDTLRTKRKVQGFRNVRTVRMLWGFKEAALGRRAFMKYPQNPPRAVGCPTAGSECIQPAVVGVQA